MRTYYLLKNNDHIEAIDMSLHAAPDYVKSYQSKGYESIGYVQAESSEQAISNREFVSQHEPYSLAMKKYTPSPFPTDKYKYNGAQTVSSFVLFFGWAIFVCGVFGMFTAVSAGGLSSMFSMAAFLSLAFPSIGALVSGLLLVAASFFIKLGIDHAENTNQIVELLRKKNEN